MSGRIDLRFRDVEVRGQRCDVDVAHGRIVSLATSGSAQVHDRPVADLEVDGRGGALLPGLHDHHLHLLALAARIHSVDCGPPVVTSPEQLAATLQAAAATPTDGWVRGVDYHESVAGLLDRDLLDRWVPDVPVRVQHRSGALWVLNSAALEPIAEGLVAAVRSTGAEADLERDDTGRLTGRLWRLDAVLSALVPPRPPDLTAISTTLLSLGITGVTDATPDLSAETVGLLASAASDGRLSVEVTLLGASSAPSPLRTGPHKILLPDHDLPDIDRLRAMIASCREVHRAVAVHCVTRDSLILTLAALEQVGAIPGDRIEHAAVVPDEVRPTLRRLGVRVVTQPDFLRIRGDAYRTDVHPDDVDLLYPHASLMAAGIPTTTSSDAPFGTLDPWRVIRSATERRTASGHLLGGAERVTAAAALDGYLSPADDPGGAPRRIAVGAPADLVLLQEPLADALVSLDHRCVRMTLGKTRLWDSGA